jgi:ABC-type multidrug transport system fused ATPase/permease subunit
MNNNENLNNNEIVLTNDEVMNWLKKENRKIKIYSFLGATINLIIALVMVFILIFHNSELEKTKIFSNGNILLFSFLFIYFIDYIFAFKFLIKINRYKKVLKNIK